MTDQFQRLILDEDKDEFDWTGIFEPGAVLTLVEGNHKMRAPRGLVMVREKIDFIWAEPDEFNLIKLYFRYTLSHGDTIEIRSDTIFVRDGYDKPTDPFAMSLYLEFEIRRSILATSEERQALSYDG